MTPAELIDDFEAVFKRRRFAAGLLLAFIDFFRELGVFGRGFRSFDEFLAAFPLSEATAAGKQANTLVVEVRATPSSHPRLVSIRPAYNRAEQYFREENHRFDYPNCAPHATGQWRDHLAWIEALLGFSEDEAEVVDSAVRAHVLATLESHEIDPTQLKPLERPFTRLLEDFDMSQHPGEPQGAAFQGAVYAFIRADAPHLHLQVSKVGAGSSRLGRYGDIDGWDGERLVLSAEVKHFFVGDDDVRGVELFLTNVTRLNAMPIVTATGFSAAARDRISDFGGRSIDSTDLLRAVDLWDPLKQRAALQAFVYYVHRIQQNKPLMHRLGEFQKSLAEEAGISSDAEDNDRCQKDDL